MKSLILLMLSATVLLSAASPCLHAQAAAPAITPPPVTAGLAWHKLTLQHADPWDILKIMHWNRKDSRVDPFHNKTADNKPGTAEFPPGVNKIYALETNNSLYVYATPEAFSQVRDIVKSLDIAPRQMEIKVAFVTAQVAQVEEFDANAPQIGSNTQTRAAKLLMFLTKIGSHVFSFPKAAINNNELATFRAESPHPFWQQDIIITPDTPQYIVKQDDMLHSSIYALQVIPRINFDNTITLNVCPTYTPQTAATEQENSSQSEQIVTILRTLPNGGTTVLGEFARRPPKSKPSSENEYLWFITATLVLENSGTSAGKQ